MAATLATRGTVARARSNRFWVELGLNPQGYPTPRWNDAIRDRVDDATLAAIKATARPLSPEDAAWVEIVRRVATRWSVDRPLELDAPFHGLATPPRQIGVLLGNQGGDDGFTSGSDAVAMDLTALHRAYGDSAAFADDAPIERLLSHEYTHLLIHPWLDRCGWNEQWASRSPFLQALRTLYNEGIAGLRSIEEPRWVSPTGVLTPYAQQALDVLQPRMVERLTALADNPPPTVARGLLRNISQGKLTDKWGSIPIALWLARSTRFEAERLRFYVAGKPDGILDLAIESADPAFRPAFLKLRGLARTQIALARATPLAARGNAA